MLKQITASQFPAALIIKCSLIGIILAFIFCILGIFSPEELKIAIKWLVFCFLIALILFTGERNPAWEEIKKTKKQKTKTWFFIPEKYFGLGVIILALGAIGYFLLKLLFT